MNPGLDPSPLDLYVLTPTSMHSTVLSTLSVVHHHYHNNKRPLTSKSMPPTGGEHVKLKT